MGANITKFSKQVERFCSSPSSLYCSEVEILLKELLKALCYEDDFLTRNKLKQLLSMIRRSSDTSMATYAHILHSIAFEEYKTGDIDFAEFLFRSACDYVGDNSLNNNLAYVLRRKSGDSINNCEVITLLIPGVKDREPFCIINMGLLFALRLSSADDWKTADKLFELLPDELNGADLWWEKLGKDNEFEGFLVHFFLLRHNKIQRSSLGSIKSIAWRLTKLDNAFPEWLSKDYKIETLYDVMRCVDEDIFNLMLDDYIKNMACSREQVDEILQIISDWDIWELYHKLLTDCVALLTSEELAKLKADYKNKFSTYPGDSD